MTMSNRDELLSLAERCEKASKRLSADGDPFEISQEPEEFGGTDDGLGTVCMVYENIQSEATRALDSIAACLRALAQEDAHAQP